MKPGNVKSIRASLKNIADEENIGFSDIITPAPVNLLFPSLLNVK